MSDPAFGLKVGVDEALNAVMTDGHKRSAADGRAVRMQFYDQHFGVKDYNTGSQTDQHPFGLILMASAEDYITGGAREKLMKDFISYKIKDHLGISWLEFLQVDPAEAETMKKLCMEHIADSASDIETANQAIKNAQRQVKDAAAGK